MIATATKDTFTMTNPKNGESIETALTDRQAQEICANSRSNFARDLALKMDSKWGLSESQMFWLHKLANDDGKPPKAEAIGVDFEAIAAIFGKAAENLKFPKLNFTAIPDVGNVTLSLCGSQSKYTGEINVTDGGRYGEGKWYGRINKEGGFVRGKAATDELVEFLKDFGSEPERIAAENGKASGRCCFCSKALTDERSTDVGYGPVCAKKWGLSWG